MSYCETLTPTYVACAIVDCSGLCLAVRWSARWFFVAWEPQSQWSRFGGKRADAADHAYVQRFRET